jgi:hypothetical protein
MIQRRSSRCRCTSAARRSARGGGKGCGRLRLDDRRAGTPLAKGDNPLIGNTRLRSYLKTISDKHFAIDSDKIEEMKKFDGIFVPRTNTDLNPLEAMLCYKTALVGGADLPNSKASALHRPIFHKLDETVRGHVFCSFLVLVRRRSRIELRPLVAPARHGRKSSSVWIR